MELIPFFASSSFKILSVFLLWLIVFGLSFCFLSTDVYFVLYFIWLNLSLWCTPTFVQYIWCCCTRCVSERIIVKLKSFLDTYYDKFFVELYLSSLLILFVLNLVFKWIPYWDTSMKVW